MSVYDFTVSRDLSALDVPFTSLIMAALRRADTANGALLRAGWPEIADELQARYKAPGGILPGDPQ